MNNYIYFNCTDEFDTATCEIWRIIGVFDVDDGTGNFEKRVKIVRNGTLAEQMPWSESDINDWTKSTLKTYLNEDYYNNINVTANRGLKESAREMIDDAVFYLGGTDYNYASIGNPEEMYKWERGSRVFDRTTFCQETGDYRCQSNYCNSDNTEHQHICNYNRSSLNWTGKVGLLYPSDISSAHAKGVNDTCYNNSYDCYHIENYNDEYYYYYNYYPEINWLQNAMLINPVTNDPIRFFGGDYRAIYSSYVNVFCEYGPGCNQRRGNVYPTVYLKSDIYTIDGDGTLESPYQIISSDSEVTSNYIYFEKPNEWANPHAYLTGDIENSWPGVKLNHVTGNIYSFRIKDSAIPEGKSIDDLNLKIQFNNGGSTYNTNSNYKYKLSKVTFEGFNKVYKISEGSTSTDEQSSGSWNNYEEKEVLGRIYYRVPTTWEYPHAYIFKDNGAVEPLGKWPGVELTKYKDNIYYFEITSDMIDDNITNYTVTFNNGGSYYHQSDTSKKYKLSDVDLIGYNKIYTVLTNSSSTSGNSTGY